MGNIDNGKCKHPGLSLRRLVEELKGIPPALVQGKTGGNFDLVTGDGYKTCRIVIFAGFGGIYGNAGQSAELNSVA